MQLPFCLWKGCLFFRNRSVASRYKLKYFWVSPEDQIFFLIIDSRVWKPGEKSAQRDCHYIFRLNTKLWLLETMKGPFVSVPYVPRYFGSHFFFFLRKFSLVLSKRWLNVYQLYFLGLSGLCKFLLKTMMEVTLRHCCVRFFVQTFHFHWYEIRI